MKDSGQLENGCKIGKALFTTHYFRNRRWRDAQHESLGLYQPGIDVLILPADAAASIVR